jgi:hypothetical protein
MRSNIKKGIKSKETCFVPVVKQPSPNGLNEVNAERS